MAATERKSHTTWLTAASGARRVRKVMPVPESAKTMGRIAESAPGARKRMATCAAAKAANSPIGTPSVARLSGVLDSTWTLR